MKKIFYFSIMLGFIGLYSSCSSSDEPNKPYEPIEVTAAQTRSIGAQNDFGLKMFRILGEKQTDTYLYSPLSMNMLLAMTANGTSGETLNEIVSALGADNLDDLNVFYRMILDRLPDVDKKSKLYLANAAFIVENYVKPEGTFLNRINQWYDAEYHAVGLSDFQTEIDKWVNSKTKGAIPGFLTQSVYAALFNALYFQGTWDKKYESVNSSGWKFHNSDGSESKATFMNGSGSASDYGDYVVAEDRFGNGHFEFLAIMPKEGVDFDNFLKNFDSTVLSEIIDGLDSSYPADIYMPKYTQETCFTPKVMLESLKQAGITLLFNKNNPDRQILDADGFVNDTFQQKNYIKVYEDGVEVASVSRKGGLMADVLPQVLIDHPYILLIRERSTGVILMAGAIRNL